jgi:hypothetical protein
MRIRIHKNILQLILGLGALFIGVLEYALSRPPDSTCLGAAIGVVAGDSPFRADLFGFLGGIVPEFVHPLAFALITMVLFPETSRRIRLMICFFWLTVDLLFEVGQYFGQQISQFLPTILPHSLPSELLINYFLRGTYDHLDVLAICMGIVSAFIIGELITRQGGIENEGKTFEQANAERVKRAQPRPILETGS